MDLPIERRLTAVYLQDHYAGATAGLELAGRARASQPDGELGRFLARLEREIAEDRDSLRAIMRHLDVEPDRAKVAAGWVGEKLGRLKLNGRIIGYSPLSRLIELEGLHVGISGKLSAWQSLRSAIGERLASFQLDELIERAESQLAELAEHRAAAARESLGD
jgi:hypothetical protein